MIHFHSSLRCLPCLIAVALARTIGSDGRTASMITGQNLVLVGKPLLCLNRFLFDFLRIYLLNRLVFLEILFSPF